MMRPSTASQSVRLPASPTNRPATTIFARRGSSDVSVLTGATKRRSVRPTTAANSSRKCGGDLSFLHLIRNKTETIVDEMAKLRSDIEAFKKSKAAATNQALYKALSNELVDLEGILSDHSCALDKAKASDNPVELERHSADLVEVNSALATELDQVYIAEEEAAMAAKTRLQELQTLHEQLSSAIAASGDNILIQKSNTLLKNLDKLHEEGRLREKATAAVYEKVYDKEEAGGSTKLSLEELSEKEEGLLITLGNLKRDEELLDMPITKVRGILVARSEEDKAEASRTELEMSNVDEEVERLLTIRDDMLAEMGTIEQDPEEIDAFLSSYNEEVRGLQKDHTLLTQSVNNLREELEAKISFSREFPTDLEVDDIQEDLAFTKDEAKASEMTLERLKRMKRQREKELEKVETLEKKIKDELANIEDRTLSMEDELVEYSDLVGLDRNCAIKKGDLEEQKRLCTAKITEVRPLLDAVTKEYGRNKELLDADENFVLLEDVRSRKRGQEVELRQIKEFLETQGQACDYSSIKGRCLSLAREINKNIIA